MIVYSARPYGHFDGCPSLLDELKADLIPAIPVPPYPNDHQNDGLGKN